jgi:hypothetical protein
MENAEKNLDQAIMLCEIYNLIGLNIQTNEILRSLSLNNKGRKDKGGSSNQIR